jgi:hypothetical protein
LLLSPQNDFSAFIRQNAAGIMRELGHPVMLDPDRPKLTPEMIEAGWGLLDTGTGTLDPVQVRDDELVDCDCGEMPAFVCLKGDWYAVEGRRVLR